MHPPGTAIRADDRHPVRHEIVTHVTGSDTPVTGEMTSLRALAEKAPDAELA